MIKPESIPLSDLPFVSITDRCEMPIDSGIYFAIDSFDTIQYIGKAVNIRARWLNHHRFEELNRSNGVRIAWILISDKAILPSIERALIRYFNPPLNRRLTRRFPPHGLEALRERIGISTTQLAARIGRSEGMIRAWESGANEPTLPLRDVLRVLDAYECSLEELVDAINVTRPRRTKNR